MDMRGVTATQGFTLIELVLVMLVLSILSVFVLVKMPGTQININAQAEELASDIRYAQTLSMTEGDRYCVVFATASYQVVNSGSSVATPLALGSTITLGTGISFGTFSPALAMIVFDGTGIPYYSASTTCNATNSAAATVMTAAENIPLSAGGQTRTIVISPETGRVITQ